MLSAADIQFEPTAANKVIPLTSSIVAMTSGDAAFNAEVLGAVLGEVQATISARPEEWVSIKDVADRCAYHRNEIKAKRAERSLLAPLGLTRDTFLRRQQEMAPELVRDLARDLINFAVPHASVIITGSDPTGLHIYVVSDGEVTCHDTIGFAAIGTGARHAQSQFMHARYSVQSDPITTILLIHAAKRRAERAPGVGTGYDLFMVRRELGSFTTITSDLLSTLDKAYVRLARVEERALADARGSIAKFFDKMDDKAAVGQRAPPAAEPAELAESRANIGTEPANGTSGE
jgi:hypothetical protein